MGIDRNAVRDAISYIFTTKVEERLGRDGLIKLESFFDSLRSFFYKMPCEHITGLIVFCPSESQAQYKSVISQYNVAEYEVGLEGREVDSYREMLEAASVIVVCFTSEASCRFSMLQEKPDIDSLTKESVALVNSEGRDWIVIDAEWQEQRPFTPGSQSNFSDPTVSSLDSALIRYRAVANHLTCEILKEVWVDGRDGRRLVLQNRPEATMRRSLMQYLRAVLNDAKVRPEHNTDESKPVDIEVHWFAASKALIEIKWIGKSLKRNEERSSQNLTEFGESRVLDGVEQLLDYIDRERSSDPSNSITGYVVVFDGRRKNVRCAESPLSLQEGLHYRDKELSAHEDVIADRPEIRPVFRIFLEPKKSYLRS